jgi:hypothetical protein
MAQSPDPMQNQFFEGRVVKPHLTTVRPEDLVVGRPYFRVSFLDEDMAVPELITLIFLGRDLHGRLPGLYFQDAASYLPGARAPDEMWASALEDKDDVADGYDWTSQRMHFAWEPPHRTTVCEFDGALEQWLSCALRREKWDGVVRPCTGQLPE